jgi:hypothetical protein
MCAVEKGLHSLLGMLLSLKENPHPLVLLFWYEHALEHSSKGPVMSDCPSEHWPLQYNS